MSKVHLENGKLLVKGEMTDVFKVVPMEVNQDMMLTVHLEPLEHTRENGVDTEIITVDVLNETIPSALKNEGYTIIKERDIKFIKHLDF